MNITYKEYNSTPGIRSGLINNVNAMILSFRAVKTV